MNKMIECFRDEAIESVKDDVLQIHKQVYANSEEATAVHSE